MTSTPGNIVTGAGKLYVAAFGAVEPADSSMSPYSPPDTSVWRDVGSTTGGIVWEDDLPVTDLTVDQFLGPVAGAYVAGTALSTITVVMAESTLDNYAVALNSLVTRNSGTGWASAEAVAASLPPVPTYAAVMVDGWAPGGSFRRRMIGRKCLAKAKVQNTVAQDGKINGVAATWTLYEVSETTPRWKRIDQNA
jgi:hypothetical protein